MVKVVYQWLKRAILKVIGQLSKPTKNPHWSRIQWGPEKTSFYYKDTVITNTNINIAS